MDTITTRFLSLSQSIGKAERTINCIKTHRQEDEIMRYLREEIRDHFLMPPPRCVPIHGKIGKRSEKKATQTSKRGRRVQHLALR
ncbi:hypothetical protein PROFUN_02507 [Planoprotostelium fungivorum]|uniref:Uncharacterized protein n=1 Tax=Planoprotostelium fungivorum TaxID=1890364 RepID=A0A2P6MP52_9EUKA|nr:hypothetical protein PROFUN_02507 [Planoprotostelium fungivorum]